MDKILDSASIIEKNSLSESIQKKSTFDSSSLSEDPNFYIALNYFDLEKNDLNNPVKINKVKTIYQWCEKKGKDVFNNIRELDLKLGKSFGLDKIDKMYTYVKMDTEEQILNAEKEIIEKQKKVLESNTAKNKEIKEDKVFKSNIVNNEEIKKDKEKYFSERFEKAKLEIEKKEKEKEQIKLEIEKKYKEREKIFKDKISILQENYKNKIKKIEKSKFALENKILTYKDITQKVNQYKKYKDVLKNKIFVLRKSYRNKIEILEKNKNKLENKSELYNKSIRLIQNYTKKEKKLKALVYMLKFGIKQKTIKYENILKRLEKTKLALEVRNKQIEKVKNTFYE